MRKFDIRKKAKNGKPLCLTDSIFETLDEHPWVRDVLIPILVATATNWVCLWLSKQ